MEDVLIVGAGFAGATTARCLADAGHPVRVIDRRPHLAGNAYDLPDVAGVLIHRSEEHTSELQSH